MSGNLAVVRSTRLTDGSMVHDVISSCGDRGIIFCAETQEEADDLAARLNDAFVAFSCKTPRA